jgi:hypothetical protein
MEWVYIYGGIAVFCGGIATGIHINQKYVTNRVMDFNKRLLNLYHGEYSQKTESLRYLVEKLLLAQ